VPGSTCVTRLDQLAGAAGVKAVDLDGGIQDRNWPEGFVASRV